MTNPYASPQSDVSRTSASAIQYRKALVAFCFGLGSPAVYSLGVMAVVHRGISLAFLASPMFWMLGLGSGALAATVAALIRRMPLWVAALLGMAAFVLLFFCAAAWRYYRLGR